MKKIKPSQRVKPLTVLAYSLSVFEERIAISQPGALGDFDDVIHLSVDQVDVFAAHLCLFANELRSAQTSITGKEE